jgi:hypothetical protein
VYNYVLKVVYKSISVALFRSMADTINSHFTSLSHARSPHPPHPPFPPLPPPLPDPDSPHLPPSPSLFSHQSNEVDAFLGGLLSSPSFNPMVP